MGPLKKHERRAMAAWVFSTGAQAVSSVDRRSKPFHPRQQEIDQDHQIALANVLGVEIPNVTKRGD